MTGHGPWKPRRPWRRGRVLMTERQLTRRYHRNLCRSLPWPKRWGRRAKLWTTRRAFQ